MTRKNATQFTEELILLVLSRPRSKLHGYGIGLTIEETSQGVVTLPAATLYQALARMEVKGLICEKGRGKAGSRERIYYGITRKGRDHLRKMKDFRARLEALQF